MGQAGQLRELIACLQRRSGPRLRLMEVCGTHTQAFFNSGLRTVLHEAGIELVSGPGCPVCVTAQSDLDLAQELAGRPGVRLATFGDMLRVPGSVQSLAEARAAGARVEVVYSPLDAVELARQDAAHDMVFLAAGFETTAPGIAAAILAAQAIGVGNFLVYSMLKTIPQALLLIAGDPRLRIDGFICPGHVSVITGEELYAPVAQASGRPCVITGFEPLELALGVYELVRRIERGAGGVCNAYPRAVAPAGNPQARRLTEQVFTPADAIWRGLGLIPGSGLKLRAEFAQFDAQQRYSLAPDYTGSASTNGCRCGDILLGLITPAACPLFGKDCTPLTPAGPCMVSQEGACQAYYKYSQRGA